MRRSNNVLAATSFPHYDLLAAASLCKRDSDISPDRQSAIRKIILNVESDISFLVELLRPIVLEWG